MSCHHSKFQAWLLKTMSLGRVELIFTNFTFKIQIRATLLICVFLSLSVSFPLFFSLFFFLSMNMFIQLGAKYITHKYRVACSLVKVSFRFVSLTSLSIWESIIFACILHSGFLPKLKSQCTGVYSFLLFSTTPQLWVFICNMTLQLTPSLLSKDKQTNQDSTVTRR